MNINYPCIKEMSSELTTPYMVETNKNITREILRLPVPVVQL